MQLAMKESDLYAPTKEWLEKHNYDVYPEIQVFDYGAVADVVATRRVNGKPEVVIIELKTSLSVALMEQCWAWRNYAHKIYACVPALKRYTNSRPGIRYLNRDGTGLLEVQRGTFRGTQHHVLEQLSPKVYAKPYLKWIEKLTDLHKEWVDGGSVGSQHLTPYKITMLGVKEYVEAHPEKWIPMKEIIEQCPHHYRGQNPMYSMVQSIREFEDWAEIRVVEGNLHVGLS